jgi:hypothetical protein
MRLVCSCIVIALALMLSACRNASSTKPASGTSGAANAAASDNPRITLENARKIRAGMTLPEVTALLGEEPKNEKSTTVGKEKYSWTGAKKRGIYVTIQNGKITDAISFSDPLAGPGDNPKITKENAAKVKKGMTLAEVKAILGEPLSSIVILDPAKGTTRTETYTWLNWHPPERSANIGFREGKVATLANYVGP